MPRPLHIALYSHPDSPEGILTRIHSLCTDLQPVCSRVDIEENLSRRMAQCGLLPSSGVRAVRRPQPGTDLVVSVGGDGTFLRAVSWEGEGRIPVAGINGGRLGYLAGWTPDEMPAFVEELRADSFRVEERSMLAAECTDCPMPPDFHPYALNEVALLKESTATMIGVEAEIDGHYLADYEGDGLIVATPTGSTGYNLSAGGPVMEPTLRAWVLSPVAPHSLTMRPLVVPDSSRLSLRARSRSGRVLLSLDGRSVSLPDGATVRVRRAPFVVRVARPQKSTFIHTLRDKLYWGVGTPRR